MLAIVLILDVVKSNSESKISALSFLVYSFRKEIAPVSSIISRYKFPSSMSYSIPGLMLS
jgi:hypothetical protein